MKKFMIFLFGVLFFFPVEKAISQEWVVPADQQALKNPYPIDNANVKTGKELYMANCRSCHGEPGKFNALPLTPPPPDVTSEQMQNNNDGMIHYKITAGRAAMPAFEKTLADEQRWKIVAFIKSFDPANAGLLVKEEPIKAKINASTDEATGVISVSATYQDKQGVWLPLSGAEIFIKAKRTFGSLPIGQTTTNEKGYSEYHFPKTFKGDIEGFLDLELSLSEEYAGNIVALNKVKIGAPYDAENLFRERVLWSTNNRTMWWLIFAYVAGVAGAWATIGYVIFQVFKIYRAGR